MGNVILAAPKIGTISRARWTAWQDSYRAGNAGLKSCYVENARLKNTLDADFKRAGEIFTGQKPIAHFASVDRLKQEFPTNAQIPVSMVFLGGGYGGRLFGYNVPEEDRIKILTPGINFQDRQNVSPLELRARYVGRLQESGYPVSFSVMANDVNGTKIAEALDKLALGMNIDVFPQIGLPRIAPHTEDLLTDKKFGDTFKGLDIAHIANEAVKRSGTPGEVLVLPDCSVSTKPGGHLDGLTMYFMTQMRKDVQNGAQAVMINSGEETGFLYNPALINWVMEQNDPRPLTFIFQELSIGAKGGGVFNYNGRNQVLDGPQIDQAHGFPEGVLNKTKNLFQVVVHVDSLLKSFGLDRASYLGLHEQELQPLLERIIYSRIRPVTEVKQADPDDNMVWGTQINYLFGQATSLLDTTLLFGNKEDEIKPVDSDARSWFPFPELKAKSDLPRVQSFVDAFYGSFLA